MPDEFADALDRLDVNFENVGPDMDIFDLLHTVLGRMPTGIQADLARAKLDVEQRDFNLRGFVIGFMVRQGRGVAVLRDARGRFVVFGAARIQEFLRRL